MAFLDNAGLEHLWTHIILNRKVDKVEGKGLSTEDFTTEEKEKLASIQAGVGESIQADWNQTDETQKDFIRNKPDEADAIALATETGLVDPATASDGSMYTDKNGVIYSLI